MGSIIVPTDASNEIPAFPIHVADDTSVTISEIYAFTISGSMTASLSQNGTAIPGLTDIEITDVPTLFFPTTPISVTDLDLFQVTPLTVSTALGVTVAWLKDITLT